MLLNSWNLFKNFFNKLLGLELGFFTFLPKNSKISIYKNLNTINPLVLAFFYGSWIKARVIYYVNNWVYTTNHKRIAVNYFWFVILSGVCGMILATIIRLEMAYPGVGILAGDSLQYLSIVTAHAVIMVFFMIMPLLFGAFGNFLLPTQLGVHDVAFPRLNSAAFWFLPAGLIMLCQLLCLDRRYQRMNCFNIREVESLLKGRFFPDLVNSHDYRTLLHSTILKLRFKTNDLSSINTNLFLFNSSGINSFGSKKTYKYSNLNLADSCDMGHPSLLDYTSLLINKSYLEEIYTFLRTPTLLLLTDGYIFSVNWFFYKNTHESFIKSGMYKYSEVFSFLKHYTLSTLERWNLAFFFLLDFSKTPADQLNWLVGFKLKFLDQFLYGYMQNNMGTYRLLTKEWPQPRNPEIIVNGGFPEFFVTAIDQFLSRSLFLYLEVIRISLLKFFWKVAISFSKAFYNFGVSIFNYLTSNFKTYVFLQEFWFFVASCFTFSTSLSYVNLFLWLPLLTPTTLNKDLGYLFPQGYLFFNYLENQNYYVTNYSFFNEMKELNYSTRFKNQFNENSGHFRYVRTLNPVFRYDYKLGNYFTKDDATTMAFLFTTINDLTGGIRKSSWFFSRTFYDLFKTNFSDYLTLVKAPAAGLTEKTSFRIQPTFSLFNLFSTLEPQANLVNHRWVATSSLDQKFYKMFLTSSMQQRIFTNWRQLKFSREAWRCKLLASRHQKTLYRRYGDEDGIFWAIERNAKDVLPGWAMVTPFSARTRFTAVGKVDIGLFGVFLVLNSSIVSSANFLVTYRYLSTLNNRKMRDARSFFTEGVMVASWMMIAANPMLVIGILMLLSDRHWQTSFFDYSGGGDTVLFQHMFWFFGHPEVYVIMIPAFGFNNTVLSFYLRKRVSARASLMYSMYTIAFLGFFVWGHHMYMVGLAHTTRMLFSTLTVMISVPAATKLMHWCVTLVNSAFSMELPLFFMLLFIFFFVSGGISGMAVANTGMDILFHDTFYVVGHFHVMFAGSAMFASFGAFYFYFPSIFGLKFSRIYGYLHCLYYLIGQLMTVIPMIWLGYSGMPRRVLDYPGSLGGWHSVVSAGHLLSVAGMTAFFIMIFDSLRQSRAATRNTFGISRFNTRLNFYLYEVARTKFLQRKGWYTSRYNSNSLKLNEFRFSDYEFLELTLFSYVLVKEK